MRFSNRPYEMPRTSVGLSVGLGSLVDDDLVLERLRVTVMYLLVGLVIYELYKRGY